MLELSVSGDPLAPPSATNRLAGFVIESRREPFAVPTCRRRPGAAKSGLRVCGFAQIWGDRFTRNFRSSVWHVMPWEESCTAVEV